jgi:hypothetical protein
MRSSRYFSWKAEDLDDHFSGLSWESLRGTGKGEGAVSGDKQFKPRSGRRLTKKDWMVE